MKLLIVEDELELVNKYTEYLSGLYPSIESANSLEGAFRLIQMNEFDVALIDYNLPDGNGLDLVKEYPLAGDEPVFAMITAYSKERIAIESLNLGVFRYIEKPIDKTQLVKIMEMCLSESKKRESFKFLSNKFTVSEKAKKILVDEHFFSPREIEVLESVLVNGKNKIVAEKLFISQGTVRNHLSNIFQKLHLKSKEELGSIIQEYNLRQ